MIRPKMGDRKENGIAPTAAFVGTTALVAICIWNRSFGCTFGRKCFTAVPMRLEARRKGLLPSTFHRDCILKPAMVLDKREHGVFAIAETTSTDLVKTVVPKGLRQRSLVPHPKMR
jgi:hypothetical protein